MTVKGYCPSTKKVNKILYPPFDVKEIKTTRGNKIVLSGFSKKCPSKLTSIKSIPSRPLKKCPEDYNPWTGECIAHTRLPRAIKKVVKKPKKRVKKA